MDRDLALRLSITKPLSGMARIQFDLPTTEVEFIHQYMGHNFRLEMEVSGDSIVGSLISTVDRKVRGSGVTAFCYPIPSGVRRISWTSRNGEFDQFPSRAVAMVDEVTYTEDRINFKCSLDARPALQYRTTRSLIEYVPRDDVEPVDETEGGMCLFEIADHVGFVDEPLTPSSQAEIQAEISEMKSKLLQLVEKHNQSFNPKIEAVVKLTTVHVVEL